MSLRPVINFRGSGGACVGEEEEVTGRWSNHCFRIEEVVYGLVIIVARDEKVGQQKVLVGVVLVSLV